MTAPLQKRSAWCAKRRTPCQGVQLGATDVAAAMTMTLHHLETQAERPCPESDYDQNEDAGAASILDMGPDARGESSTDQQRPQDGQDDRDDVFHAMDHHEKEIDEMKDMMSTFTADVKNTFTEIAHNQEECEQDFKKIRAQLKNLN